MLAGEVARDHSAENNSRFWRQPPEHRVEDVTAHVVEVDVDALRAVLFERRAEIVVLVVDAGVEAEVLDDNPALLRSPGDADHAGAEDPGDLPGDRTGGAGRGGDHHGVARLRAADLSHPEIGRGTAGSVNAHDRALVILPGDRRAEDVVTDDHVFLKSGQRGDDVADLVCGTTGLDDLSHTGGADDLADTDRWKVAGLIVEPGAHRGVQADVGGAQQRLAFRGLRGGNGDEFGIARGDQADRTAAQHDLAVRQCVGHDPEITRSDTDPGRTMTRSVNPLLIT